MSTTRQKEIEAAKVHLLGAAKSGNLLSLWADAIPVPPYPTYFLKRDDAGNLLQDADLKYVPDWSENLIFRQMVKQNCENNSAYQDLQRIFCKSSILYFCNVFCWTYDPRQENPHIPFVTFPFQDDILTWELWLMKEHETGLIEKSRDMGLTWCMEVIAAYITLFFPGMVDYQMSLREDDVDNKTEDSLLGKYRYLLRNIPDWMRGGWVEGQNGTDNKMMVKIPQMQSLVRGQLTMGTGGRSGRATRVFNDEFAFVEDAHRVLKAISALAPHQIYGSTPNGMGNAFYSMSQIPKVRKKTLHWSIHPLKNPDWARKERAKITYTDETWAQEQEVSYESSTIGRVFHEFCSVATNVHEWCHIHGGDYVEYDPHYDVYMGMDMGFGDATSILWAQLKPPPTRFNGILKSVLVFFDEEEESNRDVDYWRNVLLGTGSAYGNAPFSVRNRDAQRADYRYRELVGDYRTANQRSPTGQTWIKLLGAIRGKTLTGRRNTEDAPIQRMKTLLQNPFDGRDLEQSIAIAINQRTCPNLIKGFQNWSFQVDKETRAIQAGAKPLHNQWSHRMKAACYLVDYIFADLGKEKTRAPEEWDFRVRGLELRA